MKDLVIVESPAKAKLIQKFLGRDYTVRASMGHVRDLPDKKAELPEAKKKLPYASLAIDVEHDFAPIYVVKAQKKKVVDELKKLMKESSALWIATDEDREGEAIGFHLIHLLGVSKKDAKRIVFHEITKKAILAAMDNPRLINESIFHAQQARRVLDRLVGYKLSPLLWTKIRYGLSAGRVQSVAVRLVVEREREIEAFKADEYWKLKSFYSAPEFDAELSKVHGKALDDKKVKVASAEEMSKVLSELVGKEHKVAKVEQKDATSSPPAPYTTSTLQQDASSRLGFSVKQTMVLAQRLYEGNVKQKRGVLGGFITYMRTDSVSLSADAVATMKSVIEEKYGKDYALSEPRFFKNRSKSAQEAHEAIRPTDPKLTPESAREFLDDNEFKLYRLIWRRSIACQMAAAKLKKTLVSITAGPHEFATEGQIIVFPGFLKVYEGSNFRRDSKERILPEIHEGQVLALAKVQPTLPEEPGEVATEAGKRDYLEKLAAFRVEPKVSGLLPEQHFTKPPARYTEASLVKKLESLGIGRPSTYAPTITTIQTRGYVEKKDDKKLHPTDTAKVVNDFLVKHFSDILSYDFTARLEDQLDQIAEGKENWVEMIRGFYNPFEHLLETKKDAIKRDEVITEKTDLKCELCAKPMEIKLGRFGKFFSCTGYPTCKAARPINPDGTPGEAPKPILTGEKCPKCASDLMERTGRFGKFVGCTNYPKCTYIKKEEKMIGVKCVVCEEGQIIEKKTRRGKIFFSCNQYPDCTTAFWDMPIQKTCPVCGPKQLMVKKKMKKVARPAVQSEGAREAGSEAEHSEAGISEGNYQSRRAQSPLEGEKELQEACAACLEREKKKE